MRLERLLEEALGGRVSTAIKNHIQGVLDTRTGRQSADSYGRAMTKQIDALARRAFENLSAAAVLQIANGLAGDAATALEEAATTLRTYPSYAVAVEVSREDKEALKGAQAARLTAQNQIRADLARVLKALTGED